MIGRGRAMKGGTVIDVRRMDVGGLVGVGMAGMGISINTHPSHYFPSCFMKSSLTFMFPS